MPEAADSSIRHRHGMPWSAARLPHRWHACRPQTVHLFRHGAVLDGVCYCACGAVTDHTGRWTGRNTRRHTPDPDGFRHKHLMAQPDRSRVAAGTTSHPGAR